ncbi:YcgL domain-containing protein [Shewanella sp. NFH-SH190041]|uniref:YcgL domain-containing protein n=1 Tax=Shewanella sp. NFH-SH190041 TaxID=2950245 RepID=UPI0021C4B2F3|nr:YcgL domain-containing protein [Shewanella sp. NFH-SH190041]BDM64814.1 YcgL domain-containing protein [Shewanella sp. NFH-SH190041]
MLCAVYKSSRKAETYLFVSKRDDFSQVPEPLLAMFGTPKLVMVFPINQRDKLGIADIEKVRAELADKGYYLQLPPPPENLLKSYRQGQGLDN